MIIKIVLRSDHSVLEVEEHGRVSISILKSEWQIQNFLAEKGATCTQIDDAMDRLRSCTNATLFLS